MKYTALYLLAIVGINIGFEHFAPIPLPNGDVWPPMSLVVGIVFVLRDYSQSEIGHRVLLAMLVGAALSYWMASPALAYASLLAYMISELVDWSVYSLTRWPFKRRVWVSSAISAPVDSAVFLWAIGVHSVTAVALMAASKWVGIAAVALWHNRIDACAFGHDFEFTGSTNQPWLYHYKCTRCEATDEYCPWSERY